MLLFTFCFAKTHDFAKQSIVCYTFAYILNVAIVIADSHRVSGKKYSYYLDLRHKSLIKYADKIITINRPDRTATEKEIRDCLIEKGVAEIRIDKDMEEYFSPLINLKFDNNSLTFNEIPKTP